MPQCFALGEQDPIEKHRQLTLIGIGVIHELGIVQMRSERNLAHTHCDPAELAGELNVRLHVARIRRADINQGSVAELFALELLQSVVTRQVQITLGIFLRKPNVKSRDGHACT